MPKYSVYDEAGVARDADGNFTKGKRKTSIQLRVPGDYHGYIRSRLAETLINLALLPLYAVYVGCETYEIWKDESNKWEYLTEGDKIRLWDFFKEEYWQQYIQEIDDTNG